MGVFQLHLEHDTRQKLVLELRGYRPALFKRMQPGDDFLLVLQPGHLGFPYLSSLAWQPRKGATVQLWPRQKLKSAPAGAVREKEEK
ncbi:hypothetical protein COW64_06395 [bacterium (Candidatus Blackallbacteria) CG18_big_fil_WC_8_21_14_2_50_49_26]|nr:MAG: hypothetical protein COW64_06395 [bacterium (Candidatus Blackallbacteria) CG18_big_fil_WC_8_21_14_2_50_49_26]